MFDFIRSNTKVFFFILLALIIPSFVFVGVDGYRRFDEGGNVTAAKVDGKKISQAEWDAAHRQQADRIRAQQPDIDPKRLDSPEVKMQVLEELVRQRVILAAMDKLHFVTSDDRLKRLFAVDPQFASIRNADGSVNKELLAAQGMSSEMFAQRLRLDFSAQQVLRGITASAVATPATAKAAVDPLFQQREVQLLAFPAQKYLAGVKPSDAEVEAFYKDPAHAARFKAPESADVEYVVLDVESMKKGIAVNEEELKKHYEQNIARFTTPEERRASHVLVKAGKDMSADDRAKARARAEALLAQIKAKPSSFADIARKNSEDPGSAENGGDLDFFRRGMMAKPFEDAAYGLKKVGDLTDLVESEYGFHIIQLTGQRGGEKRSFESVRAELEDEVRTEQAQKKFSEAAVEFSNTAYEQSDSLKPVADKFKLEIQSAAAVSRQPRAGSEGPLANPRFLELLFAADSVDKKRNTEAVDLGRNRLVAGRVVKYNPARQLPLEEVRDSVRQALAAQQAAALARKEGQAKLAALKEAPQTVLTEPVVKLSRLQSREVPPAVLDAVLRAPTASLPGFLGVDLGDQGYAVVKLIGVLPMDPTVADPARAQAQYSQAWAEAEAQAYYAALKKRFKAEITAKPDAASPAGGSAN